MPRARPVSEVKRRELARKLAHDSELSERATAAISELAHAESDLGRLYASGADAAAIRQQSAMVTALKTELDGLALGREMVRQETATIEAEMTEARSTETLAAAEAAHGWADAAADAWAAFFRELLGSRTEFASRDTALREALERARKTAAEAIAHNPDNRAAIETRFAGLSRPYPGLGAFLQAVDEYRRVMNNAPARDLYPPSAD